MPWGSTRAAKMEKPRKRLTGIDSVYLYQETPTAHMHTLKISILKPAESVPTLEEIKKHFASTIHRFPALRWRLMPVPFGLSLLAIVRRASL